MTKRIAIILLALLAVAAGADGLPPFPSVTTSAEDASPVTYARLACWNAEPNAESYTLTCGAYTANTVTTNLLVPLVEGTNRLTIVAINASGKSPPAATNYAITPLRITGAEVQSSGSPAGPWTRTNLPPAQTNAAGAPVYFRLAATVRQTLDERHVP
jgi:hypothetical protein